MWPPPRPRPCARLLATIHTCLCWRARGSTRRRSRCERGALCAGPRFLDTSPRARVVSGTGSNAPAGHNAGCDLVRCVTDCAPPLRVGLDCELGPLLTDTSTQFAHAARRARHSSHWGCAPPPPPPRATAPLCSRRPAQVYDDMKARGVPATYNTFRILLNAIGDAGQAGRCPRVCAVVVGTHNLIVRVCACACACAFTCRVILRTKSRNLRRRPACRRALRCRHARCRVCSVVVASAGHVTASLGVCGSGH